MKARFPLQQLRRLMETDRIWCAYALADLYPPYAQYSEWMADDRGVVLVYTGLEVPLLFAYGEPQALRELLSQVPAGTYQYALKPDQLLQLDGRLRVQREKRMWRMSVNQPVPQLDPASEDVVPLAPADLEEVRGLFATHVDRPDAFYPSQLEASTFYGVRVHGKLASVAGTHVVSPQAGVAAMGNVFTHPAWRGRGLARRASAAVICRLLEMGIPTIVLNVATDNLPALRCYQGLGFLAHCDYYEGVGLLDDPISAKQRRDP